MYDTQNDTLHDEGSDPALSELEREMFQVLADHEKAVLAPIQARYARLARLIEARLKMPMGSIGRTHIIDPSTWTVTAQEGGLEVVK